MRRTVADFGTTPNEEHGGLAEVPNLRTAEADRCYRARFCLAVVAQSAPSNISKQQTAKKKTRAHFIYQINAVSQQQQQSGFDLLEQYFSL